MRSLQPISKIFKPGRICWFWEFWYFLCLFTLLALPYGQCPCPGPGLGVRVLVYSLLAPSSLWWAFPRCCLGRPISACSFIWMPFTGTQHTPCQLEGPSIHILGEVGPRVLSLERRRWTQVRADRPYLYKGVWAPSSHSWMVRWACVNECSLLGQGRASWQWLCHCKSFPPGVHSFGPRIGALYHFWVSTCLRCLGLCATCLWDGEPGLGIIALHTKGKGLWMRGGLWWGLKAQI